MTSSPSMQYTVMNALRTGNVVLDTVIGLLVPTAIGLLYTWWNKILKYISALPKRRTIEPVPEEFIREIIHDDVGDRYSEARNSLMQKAIKMYVSEHLGLDTTLTAKLELRALKEPPGVNTGGIDHNGNYIKEYGSTVTYLKAYKTYTVLPEDSPTTLDNGITISFSSAQVVDKLEKPVSSKRIITLKCSVQDGGGAFITKFISDAMQWYSNLLASTESNATYMYIPLANEEFDKSTQLVYRSYALHGMKTFDSLFFPQKDDLMQLLNHFQHKTGRYSIPGSPYKLGILLHGPPGTGKTSFIKSLAHATGRNIVNIQLSQVQTNQDLMDLVYDGIYTCKGGGSVKLSFQQVIFVMEDVDAASKVVKTRRREDAYTSSEERGRRMQRSERKKKRNSSMSSSPAAKIKRSLFERTIPDQLNLAGLLNVLDGCVDTPGRIVVMTSNFPQNLDPALIRPGRIDRKIYMGYMCADDAQRLAEHYFKCTLNIVQQKRLASAFHAETPRVKEGERGVVIVDKGSNYTPAELEGLCLSHNSVDGFIEAVVARRHVS